LPRRTVKRSCGARFSVLTWPGGIVKSTLQTKVRATTSSQNEHAVAVGKESIALLHRMPIRRQCELSSGEGAHQNQEAGSRQVEVREHCPGAAEGKARSDEEFGLTRRGIAFDRTNAGGPC